ncbi:MAG: RagB/SusD family nutrient uptake outer membrane protein [Prevotellaceae bacterium]|jgi:hypothetical protein|nr:RagB/SusD family nutrient uptake outer membrane protein [Prevotellaceae bacterium]
MKILLIKKLKSAVNGLLILACMALMSSCGDFLDVVPDSTLKLENIFSTKEEAYNALAKAYSYLPRDDQFDVSSWLMGDEWVTPMTYYGNTDKFRSINIMMGLQSGTTPILGLWSGTGGGKDLYNAIRSTNIFLEYMDLVKDMNEADKAEWKAQVKFLKAYYHFLLVQRYGPIVIGDKLISPEAMREELFQSRSKVDDCFDYIIRLMNEAIPDLNERAAMNELGQVDRIAATAIKARVLLFRASPFFSGNREYFEDFLDHDGEPFFPVRDDAATTKAKWKDAVDACDEALTLAKTNGRDLYVYEKPAYIYDLDDLELNPDKMKTLMDLRMLICDPWNKELLWGLSYHDNVLNSLAAATNIMCPTGYATSNTWNVACSNQWLGASYVMLERYYTANGLPVDEDKTFNRTTMYDIVTTPGAETPEYLPLAGIMQPGAPAINLYLNRELRFYANLGITGGYWRSHISRIRTLFFSGNPDGSGGGYRSNNANNYIATGIGVQKYSHPETESGYADRMAKYPFPMIRLADLYLMKAEAMNEYLDAPNTDVYAAINAVRNRAGLKNVETTWSNAALVVESALNKHTRKEGMRDIILHERSIELAFEGSRYWDMLRHRRAPVEFSSPILGWNHLGATPETFFALGAKQFRKFTITDCLCPIDLNETNTNGNLIQNPGW